ncbi:endonuclease/exonuclease/phosphatase family protein [Ornithinimicrobium sediminis]|uniref:endonuclease/exonuclease/phosphatase family protein n=1 Tax=Ornithinimicrobium sediminis TaxID=2904603 RepID=UPI001E579A3A|nr:endonuclease/exonuclease/phosphatase family protein [Ornithinimicrobium sediminis]
MRLATWNTHHGLVTDDGPVDNHALASAAAALDADVLALQEVDLGQPRSDHAHQAADLAAATGAHDWRYAPALVGTPPWRWRHAHGDAHHAHGADDAADHHPAYGVALLSRHPVRQWHTLRMAPAPVRVPASLPRSGPLWWMGDEPRAAVAAVVDTPHGTMTVVTAHLSFVPGPNLLQLRRLSRWVRTLPGPRVLLGDLNLPPSVVGRVSGFEVLARARTHPSHGPRIQLDHALGHGSPPEVRHAVTRRLALSDHLALVLDI